MKLKYLPVLVAGVSALLTAGTVALAGPPPPGVKSKNCGQIPNNTACSIIENGIVAVEGNANNPAGSVQCYVFFAGGGNEHNETSKPRCRFEPSQHSGDEGSVFNRHGSSEEVGISIAF